MSDLIKSNIFFVKLLYIISVIVITLILFNFSKAAAEEISAESEPFEIWGQSTNRYIPQLENLNLEEDIVTNKVLGDDSSNLEDVIKSDFNYSTNDTLGLYDELNGGFSSDIWKFSNFNDIDYLIKNLPTKSNNKELLDLKLKSLLTIATPPIDIHKSKVNFLQLKLDHFKSVGDYNSILSISELIEPENWDEDLVQSIINLNLLKINYKSICVNKTLDKISSENLNLKIRAFCNAMSNNLPAIDLFVSLIIEEEFYDEELVYILNSYLNETDIDLNEIQNLDLYKLNLINNKNIDFSEYISDDSEIEIQLFYINSNAHSNTNKIYLAEKLLLRGIINSETLANIYEKYLIDNEIAIDIDFNDATSELEKRALLYNQIRSTSNQTDLISLASSFVKNMANENLLINSADLIYDKIKIITPKQEYKNHAPSVCLLLLLNNDFEQCQKWLDNLDFIKDAEITKAKINIYLSLKGNTGIINKESINLLLSSDSLSEKQKNILAKYSEIRHELKLLEYWKTGNELNEIPTLVTNIKLAQYLNSVPQRNIGEMILLINLIHGKNSSSMLDQYSLFLILESLNKLDPIYLDNFIFEYFVNNPI